MNDAIVTRAENLLERLRSRQAMVATAESCTGGLIIAYLTEVAGSSDVVDRGFVTYSNDAKSDLIGVSPQLIAAHGAVSEPVARAMAAGAVERSAADMAVAVTGIAGPGGGTPEKPVGLVHVAARDRTGRTLHEAAQFGAIGRREIREVTVVKAFDLIDRLLET